MNVRELIESLTGLPPETDVYVQTQPPRGPLTQIDSVRFSPSEMMFDIVTIIPAITW